VRAEAHPGPTGERLYVVMPDRFVDGDPGNNDGGLVGDRLVTGYDPTDYGFFHGGDLAGLTQRLDYIESLGTTAVWLTPVFANKPVQGTGVDASAGYHGYWTLDYTRIDPHFGTNEEMRAFVDAAHARGLKVYFDLVVNHTADVISYADGPLYVSKAQSPYRDAAGTPFDDRDYASSPDFPALSMRSFPHVPVVVDPAEADARKPAWLNDVTNYHNRGDSTFNGEDSQYGDFFGLDDLFTERPQVVTGMTDIARSWVSDIGIDGYRLDTAKHVNTEFWQQFAPAVLAYAHEHGKPDFLLFGEVFDSSPGLLSEYTTTARLPSVLDFGFQKAAREFASGGAPDGLRDLFDQDDLYTDEDSDASGLVTFLGNHDMGRIGSFLRLDLPDATEDEILRRDLLAHSLLYLARGNPAVYYGDEQGFAGGTIELLTGSVGDKDAREDMGPTRTASYADNDLIGSDATPADDNATSASLANPIAAHLTALAAVLDANPGLRTGAQIHRLSSPESGVYAFSRIGIEGRREYVVALNNSLEAHAVTIPTATPGSDFTPVFPAGGSPVRSSGDGSLQITVPALTALVLAAGDTVPDTAPTSISLAPIPVLAPESANLIEATVGGALLAEVSVEVRVAGGPWTSVGTDASPAYRVYWSARGVAPGSEVEIRATARARPGADGVSALLRASVGGTG
jgi:alpha-amylase